MLLTDFWIIDQARIEHRLAMRQPIKVTGQLVVKGSAAWCKLPTGEKYLVGTTAFFTYDLAWKRWQGQLDRIRKSSYLRFRLPGHVARAKQLCVVNVYGRVP